MSVLSPPVALEKYPTAQASVAEVAETDASALGYEVPLGFGLATRHQPVPFHCSIRVRAAAGRQGRLVPRDQAQKPG